MFAQKPTAAAMLLVLPELLAADQNEYNRQHQQQWYLKIMLSI